MRISDILPGRETHANALLRVTAVHGTRWPVQEPNNGPFWKVTLASTSKGHLYSGGGSLNIVSRLGEVGHRCGEYSERMLFFQ